MPLHTMSFRQLNQNISNNSFYSCLGQKTPITLLYKILKLKLHMKDFKQPLLPETREVCHPAVVLSCAEVAGVFLPFSHLLPFWESDAMGPNPFGQNLHFELQLVF